MKSIKEEINGTVNGFFVFNILLLVSLFFNKLIQHSLSIKLILFDVFTPKIIITTFLYFVSLAFKEIIPSDLKASLIYWKLTNPLPGSRIFSKIAINDSRIDLQKLRKRFGDFPSNQNLQNKLWYKIYQKHVNNDAVRYSHKRFLLLREITVLSLLIFLTHFFLYLIPKVNLIILIRYSCFLFIQYIAFMIATRNAGNRFTCTVLAVESSGAK